MLSAIVVVCRMNMGRPITMKFQADSQSGGKLGDQATQIKPSVFASSLTLAKY
jgi:hypothetical protein